MHSLVIIFERQHLLYFIIIFIVIFIAEEDRRDMNECTQLFK